MFAPSEDMMLTYISIQASLLVLWAARTKEGAKVPSFYTRA
jgi:hypothetical protein